jgi:Putative peptidoglycan binding domain
MNPFSMFFALAARQADIRKAFAIWSSIKPQVTELIDLVRSIGGDVGLLGPEAAPGPSAVPEPLKKYTTQWIQTSLNKVQNAGLEVDGELGPENSKTRAAVKAFQAKHGLKVDGFPGVQTVAVLAQEVDRLEQPIGRLEKPTEA